MPSIKRLSYFTLFFSLLVSVSWAQKTESYFGLPGRNDVACDIIELYDGGYYIVGAYEGSNGDYIGWNIKTDINFEFKYDKVIDHSLSTVAPFASASDDNGNIIITGFTTFPAQWPYIVKIDSCGEKQWCKILSYEDEFTHGSARDIIINENNEVIVLIKLDSEDKIEMNHLVGLDQSGEILWTKPYASKNDYPWIDEPSGYSLQSFDNDYYISGYCYWPYPDDTTHHFLRPMFIGIDHLFEEKWVMPFAPLDSVYGDAYKSIPLNDSVFMGVGIRRRENSEDFGLMMFYTKDGEELGYNEITNAQIGPDINSNHFRDIARINDSLFIAASVFGPDYTVNPGGVLVIDTAGNLYNQQSRPNTTAADLIKTSDNYYVFATSIDEGKGDDDIYVFKLDEDLNDVPLDPTPHTYDSLCSGGIQSGTIAMTDCFVWTNIGEAPTPKEYYSSLQQIPIKAFPNPATKGQITFEFENTKHHQNMELRCYDVYGKQIHKNKIYQSQGEHWLNVSSWNKGIYFAIIYSNGLAVGECKFMVQ